MLSCVCSFFVGGFALEKCPVDFRLNRKLFCRVIDKWTIEVKQYAALKNKTRNGKTQKSRTAERQKATTSAFVVAKTVRNKQKWNGVRLLSNAIRFQVFGGNKVESNSFIF